jgi:hypothetical protein
MPKPDSKSAKAKMNPKSLENLRHEGRPPAFEEEKKRRTLTVTDSGWDGAMAVAKGLECRGVSELLELIGRGQLLVVDALSSESDTATEPPGDA